MPQHPLIAIELDRQPQPLELPPEAEIPRNEREYPRAQDQESRVVRTQMFGLVREQEVSLCRRKVEGPLWDHHTTFEEPYDRGAHVVRDEEPILGSPGPPHLREPQRSRSEPRQQSQGQKSPAKSQGSVEFGPAPLVAHSIRQGGPADGGGLSRFDHTIRHRNRYRQRLENLWAIPRSHRQGQCHHRRPDPVPTARFAEKSRSPFQRHGTHASEQRNRGRIQHPGGDHYSLILTLDRK